MATIREYFDSDFGYAAKMKCKIEGLEDFVDAWLYCDFAGLQAYFAVFVSGADRTVTEFKTLIDQIEFGRTKLHLAGEIKLPSTRNFPGELFINNKDDFEMSARFFGDDEWISFKKLTSTRRVLAYCETPFTSADMDDLRAYGQSRDVYLQFRTPTHAARRSLLDKPLAFISHDSRDKDIARHIAVELQKLTCPVWYDEFSLKLGDRLRESIERGLKETKKCVLLLSPNFFENGGWTKVEFDSIFTRQILEQQSLVLPIWYNVDKKDVYNYSPSLLDVKGLVWAEPHNTIIGQIYNAVMGDALDG